MTIRLADTGNNNALKPCIHDYQVSCGNCRLNSICRPLALENDDIEQLDDIIQRSKPLQKGQHLYRESDDLFAVSGIGLLIPLDAIPGAGIANLVGLALAIGILCNEYLLRPRRAWAI